MDSQCPANKLSRCPYVNPERLPYCLCDMAGMKPKPKRKRVLHRSRAEFWLSRSEIWSPSKVTTQRWDV